MKPKICKTKNRNDTIKSTLRALYTEKEINKEKWKYKKRIRYNFLQTEPYGRKGAER
jgi:hypothetical protein